MKAQVLITSTSASSARDVICIPRCKTLPSMISASTRFLAQPRLIMPIFGFVDAPLLLFIPSEETLNSQLPVCLRPSALDVERSAFASCLIDGHVLVVLCQRLSIFRDL